MEALGIGLSIVIVISLILGLINSNTFRFHMLFILVNGLGCLVFLAFVYLLGTLVLQLYNLF